MKNISIVCLFISFAVCISAQENIYEKELSKPNCYIINPGDSVSIPVSKAYAIWHNYLNKHKQINLPGKFEAYIVWQDANLILPDNMHIKGYGKEGRICLKTNEDVEGNALVAIKINDTIRWSWHLWITKYNPDYITEYDAKRITVDNGFIYRYNNKTPDGNYTFMDRYLGATSNIPAGKGVIGLHYQWGRKDPFPPLVDIDMSPHPILGDSIIYCMLEENAIENLEKSIVNPHCFITSDKENADWYFTPENEKTNSWNTRWDDNGHKTPFDPCPEGWRVPPDKGDRSPWFNGTNKAYGAKNKFFADKGWIFDSNEDFLLGYYAASGGRSASNGKLTNIDNTYVWTATSEGKNAGHLYLLFFSINTKAISAKANGLSIRCVKE